MERKSIEAWTVTAAAAALMALTMGSRSAFGLFVSPLNSATGLGLATISFAAATSQLAWGAAQPAAGMLAHRYGTARVVASGGLLMALSFALVPFAHTGFALLLALALMAAAGAGAGSNALLLGAVGSRVEPARQGLATGIVGAGASAGQLIFGPASQAMIEATGWINALFALALLSLLALPLARPFAPRRGAAHAEHQAAPGGIALREALATRTFWWIAGGFCVCGFHVAFLVTHMPGVIELCGLPARVSGQWLAIVGACNIFGSLAAGALIRRVSLPLMLAVLYAARGLGIALFLALPKSTLTLLAFALWMGLTYMATLPPTAGLVAKRFGTHNLPTLFGVVMFVHQGGAFLGVWLGGVALERTGSFDALWLADIALCVAAALAHLPLRAHLSRGAAPEKLSAPVCSEERSAS